MKVNGREITNPIEKFIWGIFALVVSAWTITIVFVIVLIILLIVFAPLWLPFFFLGMIF